MYPRITDFIKLFARFPGDINEVLKYFKNENSTLISTLKTEYDTLKQDITALTVKNLIPELKGFYFGNSSDDIVEAIKNIPSPFLFVLYPDKKFSGPDVFNVDGTYQVMFAVLHENNSRNRDMFERMVLEELCENISEEILELLRTPDPDCSMISAFDTENIGQVYESSFGCIGWTNIVHFNFKR